MLIRITSQDNSRIRLVRKLATRKGRNEEGRFTAEGRNLVREVLSGGAEADFIMINESLSEAVTDGRDGFINEFPDAAAMQVCVVPDRVFSKLTDAEHGIDMLAVVRKKDCRADIIDRLSPDENVLVLDRIQDPGNMGTLIRTAAAAGYGAVIAMSGTVDVYSPKVLRATAGKIFDIPVIYTENAASLEKIIRRSGRRIAVTDVNGGTPYYDADLREGIALVIGNEGRGVSDGIMKLADIRVTIPMKSCTESLNAAAAAAILMYEAVRKRER